MIGPSKIRAWFAMSLRAAGRANRRPIVLAFPDPTSITIAILPTVTLDTHRVFDLRPNGSERVFALLASGKRVTADRLGRVRYWPKAASLFAAIGTNRGGAFDGCLSRKLKERK